MGDEREQICRGSCAAFTSASVQFVYPKSEIPSSSQASEAKGIVENGITTDWDAAASLVQTHVSS